MITVKDRESIRRAYFLEEKSIREIAKELGHSRKTVRKALESAEPDQYSLAEKRDAPILGPYKERIDQLLAENSKLPSKQRYTTHKICEQLQLAGYGGSESGVRTYIAQKRAEKKRPKVFIPLEFDPGMDAQVDWGEAWVDLAGKRTKVHLFVMRLNYSRRAFVMAFPGEKQEAFLEGHVHAFHHVGGVPHRIAYDNLTTAVQQVLQGHTRREQERFIVFRSTYLFESFFCNPGEGHEKGGVEHEVGFARRNFLVPIPEVASFDELNAYLLAACEKDCLRQVDRQEVTIGQAWEMEKPFLLGLPEHDFDCCTIKPVCLEPYSMVAFETNRYSLPADQVFSHLVLKAYPFVVKILHGNQTLAEHPRCYGHHQDIFDPLHYLPLLEQRPGAFEHAKPLRQWRKQWPPVYELLLARLKADTLSNRAVREFVQILKLHQDYPGELVAQAVTQALQCGCPHADGVKLCLHQLTHPSEPIPALVPTEPAPFFQMGQQPVDLGCYEQLLRG
ncbi:MAG: IS21 family transposase [Anaerolineales bacterium]